jgi:hypothetical protein
MIDGEIMNSKKKKESVGTKARENTHRTLRKQSKNFGKKLKVSTQSPFDKIDNSQFKQYTSLVSPNVAIRRQEFIMQPQIPQEPSGLKTKSDLNESDILYQTLNNRFSPRMKQHINMKEE